MQFDPNCIDPKNVFLSLIVPDLDNIDTIRIIKVAYWAKINGTSSSCFGVSMSIPDEAASVTVVS